VHLVFLPRRNDGGAVRAFIDHAVPLLRQKGGRSAIPAA
jgi:hypothetical protein